MGQLPLASTAIRSGSSQYILAPPEVSCPPTSNSLLASQDRSLALTGDVRRPAFACSICGQQFSKTVNLRRHYKVHTGEKPYPCPACPYHASRKEHVEKHMSRIHPHLLTPQQTNTDNTNFISR